MEKIIAIVPAAGLGSRLGLGKNKAFADVGGLPLLVQCMRMLADTDCVSRVIAVVRPQEVKEAELMLEEYSKEYYPLLPFCVVAGGKERQDSVANALSAVTESDGYIAVHDGARPFAGKEVFKRVLKLLFQHLSGFLRHIFLHSICSGKFLSSRLPVQRCVEAPAQWK